ncbi:HAD family hydrolase [Rheinheimera maricola]|uniref:phosphoglycolate phosphatase n=1 Tax=Rheinheimera maricola TaxID=2793282 RepID=A0ABS7XBD8_9GAMM|nr:HAD family hydrolase [Rheinheimera maricola]MBZ9612666.1 HAD family hydrolase [Rheinheimera maricola]
MQLQHIEAVVFDLDGTLVDSALDFASICRDVGWPTGTPLLERLAQLDNTDEYNRAHEIICQHELRGAAHASWMPGAERCLQQLSSQRMPMAILTRNMRAATQLTLQRLQIPIERVLTREDCAAKPNPEGLLRFAHDLQLPVQQMLYVGDYIFDLQTAANAGMPSCLYLNSHNQHFAVQADWSFSHFDELARALAR